MSPVKHSIFLQAAVATALAGVLFGCSSTPKENPADIAAREARIAEQRAAKAAEESRAAEAQQKAIDAHNARMKNIIASYEVGKTTWQQVQHDLGGTYQVINPTAGKIAMLSSTRTASQHFVDPSKSTPLIGRMVIGTWKGTKRNGQVFATFDRDPEHFDVLITLDFVNNVLVEKQ